jgi:hypothetical protein
MTKKQAAKPASKPGSKAPKKRGRPRKIDVAEAIGAPRDTERVCEQQIDAGGEYATSPRLATKVPLDKRRGSKEPFAAQGINNELTHKERVKLTDDDVHRPMTRTTERTKRNGKSGRKQGDF